MLEQSVVEKMGDEELNSLKGKLDQAPLDWELRLSLIQAYVIREQADEAKKLVRESPDAAGPAPPQVQHRLHRLMTEGRSAAEEFALENGQKIPFLEEEPGHVSRPLIEVEYVSGGRVSSTEEAVTGERESMSQKDSEAERLAVGHTMKVADWSVHQRELENSRFVIESVDNTQPLKREQDSGRKVTALAVALFVHVGLIILLAFIVMAAPRPNPPQIMAVSAAEDQVLDVPRKRFEQIKRPKLSATSAQTTMVITTSALSPINLPEFDVSDVSYMPASMIGFGVGAGNSGKGTGAGDKVGSIGGMKITSRRLGVVLDVSGSMDAQIRAVKNEIRKNFSSSTVIEVVGCSLDWREKDPSFDFKKSKGTVRYKKNAGSVAEAVEILIAHTNVDAIFWFSDLNDPRSKEGLQRLSHLLGTQFGSDRRPVKFYVQSVDEEPDATLIGICKRSGGLTKIYKFD